jgi:hypothetical protein
MIRIFLKQLLASTLSFLLVLPAVSIEAAAQQPAAAPAAPAPEQAPELQPAPLTADQLQALVAPIALYPDALVAQVLGAATFPDQVVAANTWLQQNKSLTGEKLMKAVDAQPWDPSVKALTQFGSVLDNMAKNLTWTSSLGEAYHSQAADVMTAVQALRAKAKAAGSLQSGSQITVVQQSPQTIVIQPTNPQVVYVPQYNPTVVYGAPVATPGYSTAAVVTTAVLAFGIGIAIGASMNNNYYWGYSSWNCNWHSSTVVYRSTTYYGNSAWHGGVYGSSVTAYGPYGAARAGTAYNSNTGTYARGVQTVTPYGKQTAAQAYNPNTGAYAATHQTSNAYGQYGSSVVSKNGNTAYTQHQTTANGTAGSIQTSNGGSAAAVSGKNGNTAAAGQTASGDKYAAHNGNVYSNTGSGWSQTQGTPPKNNSNYSGTSSANSAAARGYGSQPKTNSTALSGSGGSGGGWQSRQASARGSASRTSGGARR